MLTDDDLDRLVRDVRRRGAAGAGRGLRVRRRQALPRLSRARAAQRAHAPGTLRRIAREPHALPALDRRRHPRHGPRPRHRRPAVGVRHGAVQEERVGRRRAGGAGGAVRLGVRRRSTARAEDMDAALADARELLALLERIGVRWVCITAGSPYYNPHMQRPALFPPSDGYLPPEDPLRRRRAADRRDRAAEEGVPVAGDRRLGLHLPAGVAAARRAARRPPRHDRLRRARAHGAVVSRPAGRRARRAGRCSASRSAARSATAPPARASAWCRAAIPLDPFYVKHPDAAKLKELKGTA